MRCTLCTDGRTGNKFDGSGKRSRVGMTARTKAQRKAEAWKDLVDDGGQ